MQAIAYIIKQMKIEEQVPLRNYSTMRLGGNARYMVTASSKEELQEALAWAQKQSLKFIVIGGGSNLIWRDEGFDGLVILNRITGVSMEPLNDTEALFTVGGGENWDDFVIETVDQGYSGIEFLSWIPGRAGAAPVQNIGAYGRELSEVLVSLDALDSETGQIVTIGAEDCGFGYRTSRFNRADKGRFLIISITVKLTKAFAHPPFYESVEQYLRDNNITEYSPAALREAVITVRKKKLPDPDEVANNGSFFANPIVGSQQLRTLQSGYPNIVFWELDDQTYKISAAWLIDQAGFKDYHDAETGMATWNRQPLVLINEHARNTKDLLTFKAKIVGAVEQKFGIALQQEPELI